MAQQKRTQKPKTVNWTQIGAIAIGVLFVAMMVLSSLGTGWIGGLRTIQPGDGVVIDYTIYTDDGIPVLTTSEAVMKQAEDVGVFVYLSGPIQVTAGYVPTEDLIPIPSAYSGVSPFALFRTEFKTIVDSLEGHRERDSITVPFTFESKDAPLEREMNAEDFEKIGGVFDEVQIGDPVPIGFAESPTIALDDVEPSIMTRLAYVTEKTDEVLTLRYGYAYAVVTVNSVSAAS